MKRKNLYSIFLLQFLISSFLFADSFSELKQFKTFSWRVNPKARKYEIEIIQKQPSGEWKSVFVQETQDTYLQALLPEGEYRTSLSVYNVYGVKVSTSTIERFKIQNKKSLIPFIYDDMDSFDVWNDQQVIYLNRAAEEMETSFLINGENIFFEDTRVYLEPKDFSSLKNSLKIEPKRRSILPLEIIYRDTKEGFIQVEYDYELLEEGYYNIVVANPYDYFVSTEILVLEDEVIEQISQEEAQFEEKQVEEIKEEIIEEIEEEIEEEIAIEEDSLVVEKPSVIEFPIKEETIEEVQPTLEITKIEPEKTFEEKVNLVEITSVQKKTQKTKILFPFLNLKFNFDNSMLFSGNYLKIDAGFDFDIFDFQWIVLESGVKYYYREYEKNGFFADASVRFAIPGIYFEPYIGIGAMYDFFELTNYSKNPSSKLKVDAFVGLVLLSHLDFRWNFIYDFPPNFADIKNYSMSTLSVGFKIPLAKTSSRLIQKTQYRAEIYVSDIVDGGSYKNKKDVTEIKISESAANIRNFTKNKHIQKVELGPDVLQIQDKCFADCKNLTTVILNNKLNTIGSEAFSYTTKIKELVIPSSIHFIGEDAFVGWLMNQKIILDWPSTDDTHRELKGLKGVDAKVYYNDGIRYKYKK